MGVPVFAPVLLSLTLLGAAPAGPVGAASPAWCADPVTGPPAADARSGAAGRATGTPPDSTLESLWSAGASWAEFLRKADARRAQWQRNWDRATVPADVLADARAIPGQWRLLIVAVDGCSDSVNTVPYLARLAELVPTIALRLVHSRGGRAVMEAHRTPDGRPATPTVVVLDAAGRDVGCWVERPAALQEMALAARSAGTLDAFQRNKQDWYDDDAGASTVREVVGVLAAAAAGVPRCLEGPRPLPPAGAQP
jgi:hypothetical protein